MRVNEEGGKRVGGSRKFQEKTGDKKNSRRYRSGARQAPGGEERRRCRRGLFVDVDCERKGLENILFHKNLRLGGVAYGLLRDFRRKGSGNRHGRMGSQGRGSKESYTKRAVQGGKGS